MPDVTNPTTGPHFVGGEFKSDKYAWSPPGFVPLKLTDPMAQALLWVYAQKRRLVDAAFAADLEAALKAAGFEPRTMARPADLPPADTIIDYGDGRFGPLMFHWNDTFPDYRVVAREAGFECRTLSLDEDLAPDHPLYVGYYAHHAAAAEILPKWQPALPDGAGWRLVGKHDSEDGPVAVFIRPLTGAP